MHAPAQPRNPVIFFDGVCGLCNAFVDFVMARDPESRFRFAPLQGETAAAVLKRPPGEAATAAAGGQPIPDDIAGLKSVVLWDADGLHRKSKAALRVIAGLGGFWTAAGILILVPRPLRDAAYDFIARNRYKWFGKQEACRMPTPAERDRFLP